MLDLEALALGIGRRYWRGLNPADLSGSWQRALTGLQPALEQVQLRAAVLGAGYGASALAGQGTYAAPASFVDPEGFVGSAPDGRSLAGLLHSPVTQVKAYIAGGVQPGQAVKIGRSLLDRNVQTMVADTGRAAASVDIAVRPGVGYVRMLSTPSCPRCVVLAGKFYRWNTGFQRHPKCDCRHIPSKENIAGDVTTDPYEYFRSLSGEDQDRLFTESGANAIRDGADMFQVVNSRRGMKPGGLVTTEGTSRRGNFGRGRPPRLTPEGIYSQGLPREETLRLLERNGYILPGGQNPHGVIRAPAAGFSNTEQFTAAQRRQQSRRLDWEAVQQGRNPAGGSLSPETAARIERAYRRDILGY